MKFDIQGRLKNMRLPDGKTALHFSIFEAVMNGIQAIEVNCPAAAVQTQGSIEVRTREANKKLEFIDVKDNGVGLNARHSDAFNTCDTTDKADKGGRGVGRLVWKKVFDKVDVESCYVDENGIQQVVTFEFEPTLEESRHNLAIAPAKNRSLGTSIRLSRPKEETKRLTLAGLARPLCHHFFSFFIANSMPKVSIFVGNKSLELGAYMKERMSEVKSEEIEIKEIKDKALFRHVYVEPRIASGLGNSILLTAQGRVVETIEIEKKFALRTLKNRKAYVCVVSSSFLDDRVDQDRTTFKATVDELESIREAAVCAAENFLVEHVSTIRHKQKGVVVDLLEEHPQLAISIEDVDGYVQTLSPGMGEEEIGKTLFTLLYRRERKVRDQIKDIESGNIAEQDIHSITDALVEKVGEDARLRLAEYTVKRHQIIQIAKSLLKYRDPNKRNYELEKTLHEFVCPMQKMLTGRDYNEHNLWLIDDLLSYYQFFASDKTLSSIGVDGVTKEPDILFFNPFGFRREGTSDPVVIVEFKRPGDENTSGDPVNQVLTYIEKLQDRTVRDIEGQVIDEIDRDTIFDCIIVCDLTEGTKRRFGRSVAQHVTPDGLGFYGYSPAHKATIRVISYRKLFRDAELRNEAFFKQLGLLPEIVKKSIESSLKAAENVAIAE